jgi:hypothetical protein
VAFALGGIGIGLLATARRDAAQDRRDAKKRRADKFEELVAAVYDFDHWLDNVRQRDGLGIATAEPQRVSPFAKVQATSAVYFPQFNDTVAALDVASLQYRVWIHAAARKRLDKQIGPPNEGLDEVYKPYLLKRETLLKDLKAFAAKELQ